MSQRNTAVPSLAEDEACPIGEVLDHVAGKWSIGIIIAAAAGPVRFTELERTIQGISAPDADVEPYASWSATACWVRTVYPTVPPRVDYQLTLIALELVESFAGLTAWAGATQTCHRQGSSRLRPSNQQHL